MTKPTIAHAQANRLQNMRSKSTRVASHEVTPDAIVLTTEDRDRVLSLFTANEMSLDQLCDNWLKQYEPRQHLRWWITIVLAHLNDRSRVSIRFEDEQPVWALINI